MSSFLALPTTLLLVVAELVVLLVLVVEVVPVHRRAGLLACTGLVLAASASLGLIVAEVAMIAAIGMGTGPSGFELAMVGIMLVGTFVPPVLHALALGAMGLAILRLLRRLEGTDDEGWAPASGT